MADGLNSVLYNDRASPTDTNPKNLELSFPPTVTATRLDQLVYSPNCYVQIFRHNFSLSGARIRTVDRNFLEELMKNNIIATRTVMKRYIPAETDMQDLVGLIIFQ